MSSVSIFFGQLIGRFAVVLLVDLLHLLSKFLYFAIDLGLGFVAADNCHDFLCVILGHPRLLGRCAHRYGDQQKSYDHFQGH